MLRDKGLDRALGLLSDDHTIISKRCRRYWFDNFEIRPHAPKAVCVAGEEAARMFYLLPM